MIPLLPLSEVRPGERVQVGGKAANLAVLLDRGLPVPRGFVVPVRAFEQALSRLDLTGLARQAADGDADAAQALREALQSATMPSVWAGRLRQEGRRLGDRLAVRSSAPDEDGRTRSFAGQHLSLLDVAPDDLPNAVMQVWGSLYASGALAYRGRGPAPGAMAVLVQPVVDAAVSGILFTINPLNGSWREMIVEATWGLATDLMAGKVAPHWYLVRRPRKLPGPVQRLWSRVRLQPVQEDIHDIDGRSERTLSRSALLKLCRLGLRIERILGEPQDVEWVLDPQGQPHVVQARPITRTGTPRVRRDVLWTRRFIGERWPEPATPLGWSVIQPLLDWFIAYPEVQARYLGGGPALRLVRSRPYVNATVFRHLLFKLPGAQPPRFMLELIPPNEVEAWRQRFAVRADWGVYRAIFKTTFEERRWERFRFNPFTNHLRWQEFQDRLEGELPRVSRTPATVAEALRLLEEQRELIRDYIGIHVTSLLFANLWYQMLESYLAVWLPEDAKELVEGLAVNPPGNLTLATNEALWELARLATPEELERLGGGRWDPDTPFGQGLAAFLEEYGHRSVASWEIFSPRWKRYPAMLAPLLRAQRSAPSTPSELAGRQQVRFERAQARLRERLRGRAGRSWVLEGLVHLTRSYLLLRENQRFWFDRLLHAMQETFLWVGAELVERGVLSTPGDVQYLTWEELRGVADGSLPLDPEWVPRRRAQREEDARHMPPVFLLGDEGVEEQPAGLRLQGLGISPGRARGRVRIVPTLEDGARLEPGDVLVTRSVDPGWTPLFLTAGAVVMEMGSLLSHGAVVAREYGVPAVVNIDGVTRRLKEGQEVTVDGNRGVIWVHP